MSEPFPLPPVPTVVHVLNDAGERIGPARECRLIPVARPARRPRVFLSGPISKGDLATNINRATEAFLSLAKAGLAPFCPHWSVYAKPAFRDPTDPEQGVYCLATVAGNPAMTHEDWLGIDLAWVATADALLRLPGESVGADREVAHAGEHLIPTFHDVPALLAHFGRVVG